MTLDELLAALTKLPEGAKLTEAIKALIATKETEIAQKGSQCKGLTKTLKESEEKLKATSDRLTKLHDHLGIDEDVEDLDGALAEAAKAGKKGGDEALLKRLEKLEKSRKQDKDASDKLLAEERSKRHDLLKRQTLLSSLTAGNAARADELVGLLSGMVQIGDDDELTFVDEKGQSVRVEDGVKGWLAARPEFVKNAQNPGAGSGAGGGKGGEEGGNIGKTVATKVAETAKASSDAQTHFFG
ncbi:hypothetical protein [Anaerospora sp.]|uniref:hypothetical protein n=1 Tax=Anaerospora sp. TaxID=1960278 RepID=UPI00289AF6B0|nr:hypothetical protein [Anaerospora sp.]